MSETRETEIRALQDLMACDGWAIFVAQVRDQWQGEKFVGRLKMAMNGQAPSLQTESVREVFAARTAIEDAIVWPDARRKKLQADDAAEAAANSTTTTPARRA